MGHNHIITLNSSLLIFEIFSVKGKYFCKLVLLFSKIKTKLHAYIMEESLYIVQDNIEFLLILLFSDIVGMWYRYKMCRLMKKCFYNPSTEYSLLSGYYSFLLWIQHFICWCEILSYLTGFVACFCIVVLVLSWVLNA